MNTEQIDRIFTQVCNEDYCTDPLYRFTELILVDREREIQRLQDLLAERNLAWTKFTAPQREALRAEGLSDYQIDLVEDELAGNI